MYGAVPPETVAVNDTRVALVGFAGENVKSADRATAAMVMLADLV